MKRSIIVLLLLIMVISSVSFAAPIFEDYYIKYDDINIYYKGKKIIFSESLGKPYTTTEYRTMIPLRVISEKMGYKVSWDKAANATTIKGENIDILLPISKKYGFVNGNRVEFDTHTTVKGGKVYVPLRFVSESLGFNLTVNTLEYLPTERDPFKTATIITIASTVEEGCHPWLIPGNIHYSIKTPEFVKTMSKYGATDMKKLAGEQVGIAGSTVSYYKVHVADGKDWGIYISDDEIIMMMGILDDKIFSMMYDALDHLYPDSVDTEAIVNRIKADFKAVEYKDQFGTAYMLYKLPRKPITVSGITFVYYLEPGVMTEIRFRKTPAGE